MMVVTSDTRRLQMQYAFVVPPHCFMGGRGCHYIGEVESGLKTGATRGESGSTKGLALLNCKRRRWSEWHQNNGVKVYRLTDDSIGKGVDRGSHCKEENDSFGEHYDGWVRDMIIGENGTRPQV